MKKYSLLILIAFILFSCGENKPKTKDKVSAEELKNKIKEMDDSLKVLYKKVMDEPEYVFPTLAINEAIDRNLDFYRAFPKDPFSAVCLDKVQQLYMQEKAYDMSLKYTDTLLIKFPKYAKKAELLLNAGSTGEIMQDTAIVRKYYSKLLKECPKIASETKQMVEFRLKHLNLSFDQLIDLQIKNATK